jgi:hypothetical protein
VRPRPSVEDLEASRDRPRPRARRGPRARRPLEDQRNDAHAARAVGIDADPRARLRERRVPSLHRSHPAHDGDRAVLLRLGVPRGGVSGRVRVDPRKVEVASEARALAAARMDSDRRGLLHVRVAERVSPRDEPRGRGLSVAEVGAPSHDRRSVAHVPRSGRFSARRVSARTAAPTVRSSASRKRCRRCASG